MKFIVTVVLFCKQQSGYPATWERTKCTSVLCHNVIRYTVVLNVKLIFCFAVSSSWMGKLQLPDFIPWGSGYESVYYGLWDSTPT